MNEEEFQLYKCIAHWSYLYFDAISMLKYITDKESRKELREQRDYSKKRLFEALAVYHNKYALGPFVVPQGTKPVTVPKDPLDMNFLNVKNKIQC